MTILTEKSLRISTFIRISLFAIHYFLDYPPVHSNDLTRNIACSIRGQEDSEWSYIFRIPWTAQGYTITRKITGKW